MSEIIGQVVPKELRTGVARNNQEVPFMVLLNALSNVVEGQHKAFEEAIYNYRRLPAIASGGMQLQTIQGVLNEAYAPDTNLIYITYLWRKPYNVSLYIPDYLEEFREEMEQVVKYKLRVPLTIIRTIIYNANVIRMSEKGELNTDDSLNILYKANRNPNTF